LEDTMPISPDSLYELCIEEIANCLQMKYWSGRKTNPFSRINCNIVNDLFQYLIIQAQVKDPRPLKSLLKSGQLQKLNFNGIDFTGKMWRYIMKILLKEKDRCRNITYIFLPKNFQNDENTYLERLIEQCPLLKEIHVGTYFNLSVLKNCERLKVVRNYFPGTHEYRFLRDESVDTLENLQNLEKFAIFDHRKSSTYYEDIAKILQNHPKLVSLGNTDSSWAAHHIHTTCRMDTAPRFGLKECFWGFAKNVEQFIRNQMAYSRQYPELIKSSVVLFPLVKRLHIIVHHADCLQHLKKLEHLCELEIDFNWCCSSSACTAFISLLSEIGPQLKRLVIVSHSTMPVDLVMKYCSNLEHLNLCCSAIVQGGVETNSNNFRELKELVVYEMDEESLEYLLRNSFNLKGLLLVDALCLDDTLLRTILLMKSLSKIETLGVYECRISRYLMKKLVQKCVKLRSAAFDNQDADLTAVAKQLKRDIRTTYSHVANRLQLIPEDI
ncbi:uncharacterized protein CEXT_546061, partial [Caerostris extrusa]